MKHTLSFKLCGILFLLLFLCPVFSTGQTTTVQGTVQDLSFKPLSGVSVSVIGTSTDTLTDANGQFTLQVPAKAKLKFERDGYATKTVKMKGQTIVDVVLLYSPKDSGEEVNIGYGTVKKSNLTQSVGSVDKRELQYNTGTTVVQLFEHVAGVEVVNSGGTIQLRIRGVHTFMGSNEPLIILDGSPYTGAINELNKDDIKSIDVLKDASATAIYGSRGANGVILITTKSGGR